MDLDDLVKEIAPPPNRVGRCEGKLEHHLPEGAVMIAYDTPSSVPAAASRPSRPDVAG
ncbi:hypothetical protein ACVIGA_002275 [Bradyrhizobium sp. USDA 3240]